MGREQYTKRPKGKEKSQQFGCILFIKMILFHTTKICRHLVFKVLVSVSFKYWEHLDFNISVLVSFKYQTIFRVHVLVPVSYHFIYKAIQP